MKSISSYIRKTAAQFIDPFPGLDPDKKINDRELTRSIRQALSAEEEAVHFYEAVVDATDNELAKKVFESIANEERVHIGEFQTLLNNMLPEEQNLLDDGEKEVNEMKE